MSPVQPKPPPEVDAVRATKASDKKAAGPAASEVGRRLVLGGRLGLGRRDVLEALVLVVRLDGLVEPRARRRRRRELGVVVARDAEVAVGPAVTELDDERLVGLLVAQAGD